MNQTENNRRKRITSTAANPSDIGKLPPQAIELEESVLGAILLEREALEKVVDIIHPELFYKEQNTRVFDAILSCRAKGFPVDILTVTNEAKGLGTLEIIGGAYYISQLTNRIASSANIEFHVRIVQQAWIKRELIRVGTNLIREAYEDGSDVFETKEAFEKTLLDITKNLGAFKFTDPQTLMNRVLEENTAMTSKTDKISGIPSGFVDLDGVTHGWHKSDLIILAARPGMGKTAFAVQWAANAAVRFNKKVGIFSLEQSDIQLYKRICAQQTEIPLEMLMHTGMDQDTLNLLLRDTKNLVKSKLFIDDTGGIDIIEIRSRARRMVMQLGVEMIVVDYLQLIPGPRGSKGNREQEIEEISRGLKTLAKELDIPIVALSQLSRQTENRPGGSKIPQLSDLRNSGAIEQDADMIMFIYRAEYYGMEVDSDNQPTKGKAKIIIAKNRHGALTDIDLRWKGECTMFKDLNPSYDEKTDSDLAPNTSFLNKKEDKDDLPF